MEDYSSLHKKLMLEKFDKKLILNMPEDMHEFDSVAHEASKSAQKSTQIYDLIISFVFDLDEMERDIESIAEENILSEGGYLYLAYPKKGNKKYSKFIERDSIFPRFGINDADGYFRDTLLKFSKMVALNETFTIVGLKREKKKAKQSSAPSQCVDDYLGKIPDLRTAISHRQEILDIYDKLTPGYQKDWARYVYSAKSEETREKRLLEMAEILSQGYKTKDLYRQAKK